MMKVYNEFVSDSDVKREEIDNMEYSLGITFELPDGRRFRVSEGHDDMLNINTIDNMLSVIPESNNSVSIRAIPRV